MFFLIILLGPDGLARTGTNSHARCHPWLDGSDVGVKVDFAEGGKPEYPEKNPRSQIEMDKSQPTYQSRI